MVDRPILYSAAMVQALLDGRKTQTRRLATSPLAKAEAGDRLYVRETWAIRDAGRRVSLSADAWPNGWPIDRLQYLATEETPPHRNCKSGEPYWWNSRPSIHMPRWASRITLIATDVRRQALQEISSADAIAEGIRPSANSQTIDCDTPDPRDEFNRLWDELHGAGSWDANPEIVALTYEVHQCNIDRMGESGFYRRCEP